MAANNSFKPARVKPTLTNGDCFFSSIYRAANEQGILHIFREFLGVPIDEGENSFILYLRNLVADRGKESIHSTYDYLRSLHIDTNSHDLLNNIMNDRHTFDDWHKKIIRETITTDSPSKQEFTKRIIEGIRTTGNYVGQIEFGIMKDVLEECNIILETKRTPKQILQTKRIVGEVTMDVITVYNCNHGHFEYFSFSPTANKTRNRRVNAKKHVPPKPTANKTRNRHVNTKLISAEAPMESTRYSKRLREALASTNKIEKANANNSNKNINPFAASNASLEEYLKKIHAPNNTKGRRGRTYKRYNNL